MCARSAKYSFEARDPLVCQIGDEPIVVIGPEHVLKQLHWRTVTVTATVRVTKFPSEGVANQVGKPTSSRSARSDPPVVGFQGEHKDIPKPRTHLPSLNEYLSAH